MSGGAGGSGCTFSLVDVGVKGLIFLKQGRPRGGGWSVKVLPGFQYTFPFNLGVFAEIGWAGCGYGADLVNHMFHSAVINFGVTYTFAK